MLLFRWAGVATFAALLSSCDKEGAMSPGTVDTYLIGAAARSMDARGRFVLLGSEPGELTQAQAVSLSTAYVRTAARWIGDSWERDRGTPVDFREVTACPRAYYAKSTLDLKGRGSASLRQFMGGKWLVSFCLPSGAPVLSVAVSAEATDLQVIDGHIVGEGGMQFTSAGIPTAVAAAPLPPEDAARLAAERTGRRVIEAPELVLPPSPYPPQLAKWRVKLDGPVAMRGVSSGNPRVTDEVYVGFAETWNSSELQLGSRQESQRTVNDPGAAGAAVIIPVRVGYPTSFERATVEQP